jgi:protein-tyrosine-phosphatase
MAEALLKRLVSARPDATQWHIESAGTWAMNGHPPAELSQYVMQSMGMDISTHKSQLVTQELIQRFDLILTMESNHKEGLIAGFRNNTNRIYMLSEIVGLVMDIPDPIGGQLSDYEETAKMLEHILTDGLEWICQKAAANQ